MDILKAWPLVVLAAIAIVCVLLVLRWQRKITRELEEVRNNNKNADKLKAFIDLQSTAHAIQTLRDIFPAHDVVIDKDSSVIINKVRLDIVSDGIWISTEISGHRRHVSNLRDLKRVVTNYMEDKYEP